MVNGSGPTVFLEKTHTFRNGTVDAIRSNIMTKRTLLTRVTRYTHPNGELAFQTKILTDGRVEMQDSKGRALSEPITADDAEYIVDRAVDSYGFMKAS
jgi:hypothetical protein